MDRTVASKPCVECYRCPLTGLVVCRILLRCLRKISPSTLPAWLRRLPHFSPSLKAYRSCSHMPAMQTHTPQPVSCDEPRCLISTTCCHKYVFVNKTWPLATLRLIYILICGISAPSDPRTRRFPTRLCRSTSSRAIFESG